MFDMLWNVILGIIGGIISSVIVSRVFFLHGDNQKQLDHLSANVNKISFIHGELTAFMKMVETIHDDDVEMRNRETPYDNASDDEIRASQKMMDDYQQGLLETLKEDLDKINIELENLFLVDIEAQGIVQHCIEFVHNIRCMNHLSFAAFDELGELRKKINEMFREYVSANKRRLIKQILKDPVMIALCVVVLVIVIGAVVAKTFGI